MALKLPESVWISPIKDSDLYVAHPAEDVERGLPRYVKVAIINDCGKPPAQYVLVRKDLPVYVQMVNVGHACGEAITAAPISKRTVIRLLHVTDEAELLQYRDRLVAKGFHVVVVHEPDEPYNGQAMSLATEPLTERISAISKIVFHLKTARANVEEASDNR